MSTGTGNPSDELLVFGYSCKLFRHDDVASRMDQGEFLIPWTGDPTHRIDRFDGRAVFHDIGLHEAPNPPPSIADYMGPEERTVEEMCEDERWRSLKDNPPLFGTTQPEQVEDAKSDSATGGAAIGFDYNAPPPPPVQAAAVEEGPSLKTLANVLEKTAGFIASQGAQMEILMRAKEAANPKFQFLNPDNPYHPIYKQVLEKKREKIKNPYLVDSGQLKQLSIEEVEASLKDILTNLPSAAPGATPTSESANKSSNNAYSKLVERIKEHHKVSNPATPSPPQTPPPPPPPEKVDEPVAPPVVEESNQQPTQPEVPSDEVTVEVPPMDLQMLIDRTASYVCRQNQEFGHQKGADKISVVKKLHREKFSFLFPENKYNTYYLFKVALYTEMFDKTKQRETALKRADLKRKAQDNSQSEMQELTLKSHPSLKGFFNS